MNLTRLRPSTLRTKMLALIVPLSAGILLATVWLAISSSSDAQKQAVSRQMSETAEHHAKAFESQLRESQYVSQTLAATLSGMRGATRREVLALGNSVMRDNTSVMGIGVQYHAGTFGDDDAAHVGELTSMPKGQFAPHWDRFTGKLRLAALQASNGNEEVDYAPNTVLDPPILVNGAVLTAFLNPIKRGGKTIGVVGTDTPLATLQAATSRIKVLDSGFAALVSKTGVIVAGPDKKANGKLTLAQLAKRTGQPGWARLAASVKAGRASTLEVTQDGKDLMLFSAPMDTSGWSLVIAAPKDEVFASVHELRNELLIAGVLGVLLLAGATAFVAGRLTRPLSGFVRRLRSLGERDVPRLRDGLLAMSSGDLTVVADAVTEPVDVRGNDEIAVASGTLNELIESTRASIAAYDDTRARLGEMIGGVARGAGNVNRASQQMADTSNEAGRAVGEIAHAVSEVADGAERQVKMVESAQQRARGMGEVVQGAADQAQETAAAAERAREVAAGGVEAAREASEAMLSVRESSQAVHEAMRSLNERSDRIGGIVETITGIAEQTNLLALNAAIEAARAGDHGRGFAVVADEVRKLAEESQVAAGDIGGLVREIQAETGRALEVVSDGARRTERGSGTVEQARDAFVAIGEAVEEMTARVGGIAAAASQIALETAGVQEDVGEIAAVAEQSSASSQQVSAATQQTSASSQEIAASAQELADTAAELERLVAVFRVEVEQEAVPA